MRKRIPQMGIKRGFRTWGQNVELHEKHFEANKDLNEQVDDKNVKYFDVGPVFLFLTLR